MGSLRLVLAMLVAGAHLGAFTHFDDGGWITGHAIFAVRAFFVLSGFYMAMVLASNDRYKSAPRFYFARAVKILPLYWLVVVITMLLAATLTPVDERFSLLIDPISAWHNLHPSTLPWGLFVYIGVSMTMLLGMDTGLWLGFNRIDGALSLAPDYAQDSTSVVVLSPIPQTWTIGLELTFYLVAPFLVRWSWKIIAAIAAASVLARVASYGAVANYPWNRSLFPLEVVFFILGVLAFKAYASLPIARLPLVLRVMVMGGCAAGVVFLRYVATTIGESAQIDLAASALVAAALPFLFDLTRKSSIDRCFGDFSYPLYAVVPVVWTASGENKLRLVAG